MRHKLICSFIACILCTLIATSQSIYSIEYTLRTSNSSASYYGFLQRNEDGGGLLRIRFTYAPTGEDIVKEMDIEEMPVTDKSGMIDTVTILLKPGTQKTIVGNSNVAFTPPYIILKYNEATDFFEPAAITFSEREPGLPKDASFKVDFLEKDKITKAFMAQFYTEDEEFFKRYFTDNTRGLTATEKKKYKFHLLLVADTLDKSIGSACAKDVVRMVETFTSLAKFLDITLLPTYIWGKQYNKKNIEDVLKKLAPAPNDIVVFYYSGHGFRIPEKLRRFPNLKLKHFPTVRENFRDSLSWARQSRKDNIAYSMNIEDIFNTIKNKKARFNLVISDCCNDDIFSVNVKSTKPGKTKASGVNWSEDNIRALFLDDKPMSILVTAAQSGELAASNDKFGSFFSYFFKSSLETYCSKMQAPTTWDVLIQSAQKQTVQKAKSTYCAKPYIAQNLCKQNPDYITLPKLNSSAR